MISPRPLNELPLLPFYDAFYDSVPVYVAFIINNKVELIIHVNQEQADLLVNNQKIIQTDLFINGGADREWTYNPETQTCSAPDGYQVPDFVDEESLPKFKIAIIKDNLVQDLYYFNEREASVLLSNPLIKIITSPYSGGPRHGWMYDTITDTYLQQ